MKIESRISVWKKEIANYKWKLRLEKMYESDKKEEYKWELRTKRCMKVIRTSIVNENWVQKWCVKEKKIWEKIYIYIFFKKKMKYLGKCAYLHISQWEWNNHLKRCIFVYFSLKKPKSGQKVEYLHNFNKKH